MRKSYIPSVAELEAFRACAKLGTTTLAAKSIGLTQSAISRSISTLEERLGVNLFVRARQRLSLSDAGRVFLHDVEKLLQDLNEATVSVMAFGGHSQIMRLAVLPTFGRTWLIPRLAEYMRLVPDMTFDVAAALDPIDFEQQPFDLAIQRSQHRAAGSNAQFLLDEVLVIVAAPALMNGKKEFSDDDLSSLPLLQQATRPTLWLDWFRTASLDPRRILRGARFEHFDMMIDAAKAGLGVALVPEILARAEIEAGSLIKASSRRMLTDEAYMLYYPDRSTDIPGFEKFCTWLSSEIGSAPKLPSA